MTSPFTLLLGTAQDGGFPHVGCLSDCCARALGDVRLHRDPCCLAIVDPESQQRWMIDCTPEFPRQLRRLDRQFAADSRPGLDGILLTHAHMGHYTGLMFLGSEALASDGVPLHAMPRMRRFLAENAPWNRLIQEGRVDVRPLTDGQAFRLNERIAVTPMTVPHRGEDSETVAFRVEGPNRAVLYLPDVDGWDRWATRIEDVVKSVDVAYLDGTFFDATELPDRDRTEFPHPHIAQSIERFALLPANERTKIRFIHMNHTNPVLDSESPAFREMTAAGLTIAGENALELL